MTSNVHDLWARGGSGAAGPPLELAVRLEELQVPAYLVNPRLGVEWANGAAAEIFFGTGLAHAHSVRNVFSMLREEIFTSADSGRIIACHAKVGIRPPGGAPGLELLAGLDLKRAALIRSIIASDSGAVASV